MSQQQIELRKLLRHIDHEYIIANSMEDFYRRMNKFDPEEWTTFGETLHIGNSYIRMIIRIED